MRTYTNQFDMIEVASQAIEFWITVALYELAVIDDLEDEIETTYLHIIEQAAKPLLPLLLQTLTKQPEDPEDGIYLHLWMFMNVWLFEMVLYQF